jgi:FkbH-like protein
MNATIAIAANFTIEPILPFLGAYLDKLGLQHQIGVAPYNQIFQQLLDPSSLFYGNEQGVNVIFLRIEDLSDGDKGLDGLESNVEELAHALSHGEQFKAPVFVFVCPPSADGRDDISKSRRLEEFEALLIDRTGNVPNVHFFETRHLPSRYSIGSCDNSKGNELAHVPYTEDLYSALAVETVRRIDAHLRKPHKVIVLDCDNTLWDGVCGEDGTDGISFCDARLALQKFAVEQSREGMLVCLCSKNNEPDVWDVFDRRAEMPLKREHLVSWRINWEPKSSNLRSLADELQLGLDSFIFVDDDPAVCAEVRENCPEVFTFLLPQDTERIPSVLDHLWVFDRLKVTDEDRKRTEGYQREAARKRVKQESSDLATFLDGLGLVCEIAEIREDQIPRVSQLSFRTNQFNSTTLRRSEADVRKIVSDGKRQIWTVTVKDRFGDYGLVGVVSFEPTGEALCVDSFMLSCRALGRGVEHRILREIGSSALNKGIEFVDIEFRQTEKNIPIRKFLEEIAGSTKRDDGGSIIFRITAVAAAASAPNYNSAPAAETRSDSPRHIAREEYYTGAEHSVYFEIAETLSQGILSQHSIGARPVDRPSLSAEYAPPRSETERKLLQIWEKLLNRTSIGVFDNFFELGGDSLLGVSLFVEIEERFGSALPLSALIESPTVVKLAEHLDGSAGQSGWKYLVPVQDGGDERPLFCMHAAGGNVLFYRDLAKELGSNQPVFGLQARGVADKTETAHDRVEDMAAEYLKEIRSFQPNGPYRLCGSSFGGLVAFEVARQLTRIGEDVDVLALFDTYAPGYLKDPAGNGAQDRISTVMDRIRNLNNQLREIDTIRGRIAFFTSRIKKLRMRLKRKALWKKNQFAIQYSKATGKDLPVDLQRNHKAIQTALDSYVPSTYSGELILFRATDQPSNVAFDPYLGWTKYVKSEIPVIEVKGTHGALTVYPFAEDLARKFKPFLVKSVSASRRVRELALTN